MDKPSSLGMQFLEHVEGILERDELKKFVHDAGWQQWDRKRKREQQDHERWNTFGAFALHSLLTSLTKESKNTTIVRSFAAILLCDEHKLIPESKYGYVYKHRKQVHGKYSSVLQKSIQSGAHYYLARAYFGRTRKQKINACAPIQNFLKFPEERKQNQNGNTASLIQVDFNNHDKFHAVQMPNHIEVVALGIKKQLEDIYRIINR